MESSERCEAGVQPARDRFRSTPAVGVADLKALWPSLIRLCALDVAMTEPVEGWIHRAGASCVRVGCADLRMALHRGVLTECVERGGAALVAVG
ncbi:MAG: hypothetical protein ACRD0K_18470 [Egibacteraceae bacterium]